VFIVWPRVKTRDRQRPLRESIGGGRKKHPVVRGYRARGWRPDAGDWRTSGP